MKTKKCIKSILVASISLLLLFYLSGCAKTKQDMLNSGMQQMTTKELQSLFSDKQTAKVFYIKKNRWYTVTYLPDGTIATERKGKTRYSVYTIEKSRLCSKKSSRSTKETCSSWFKVGDKKYETYGKDGSLSAKLTFQ